MSRAMDPIRATIPTFTSAAMKHKRNRRLWLILVRGEILKLLRRGEAVRPELLRWTGERI